MKETLKAAIRICGMQVLLFPILVVLFASSSFVCGGTCASWQWWVSLFICMGIPFCRYKKQLAVYSLLLFVLVVLGMLLTCCFNIDPTWVDNDAYHLPIIRMLMEGWNPFMVATPETVGSTMAIDPFDMRIWHVLSVHKAVHVFNAVTALVHNDPLAITYPAWYFAFIGCSLFLISSHDWVWQLVCFLIFLLWRYSYGVGQVVDAVVGFSGVALLISMNLSLEENRFMWTELLGYSIWMTTSKASGALACFAMWITFFMFVLINGLFRSKFRQVLMTGSLITGCFLLVCSSPYISAWREYGHPLYPASTVDENRFPHVTITEDLVGGNRDFKLMSPVGSFVNAYISPALAMCYYNWRLNRDDFCPMNRSQYIFAAEKGEPTATCPTTFRQRIKLWVAVTLLLMMPKCRFLAVAILSALAFVPHQYYGYLRYFPWLSLMEVYVILLFCYNLFVRFKFNELIVSNKRFGCVAQYLAIGLLALVVPKMMLNIAVGIDSKLACQRMRPACVYSNVYGTMSATRKEIPDEIKPHEKTGAGSPSHEGINAIKLLSRQIGNLKNVDIIGVDQAELDGLHRCPMGFYTKEKMPLMLQHYNCGRTHMERVVRYPEYVAKMLVTWILDISK